MNPGSAGQALESLINVDMSWIERFYAGQTKPAGPGRSSRTIEVDLTNIVNTANKRSRTIAPPAINTGAISYRDLAAGTMDSWNAASLINSLEAIPSPRSSCFINKKVPAAVNTSPLHKYSSAFTSGLPAAAEAAASLSRGAVAVKVKKKRVRPSRRVPTTMVDTDTSNFKAMVQHFTGIPSASATDTTQQSSASTSSPHSTISAIPPSFRKPLPHPVLCKISNSFPAAPNTTTSRPTAACPSPLLPSSFPSCQSLPELPVFMTESDHDIPSFDDPEEPTISLIDAAFFDELWT